MCGFEMCGNISVFDRHGSAAFVRVAVRAKSEVYGVSQDLAKELDLGDEDWGDDF